MTKHDFTWSKRSLWITPILSLSLLLTLGCEDDPKPPTAVITAPESAVTVGAWLELSAEESVNPKGEAANLNFTWRLVSIPLGSEATLIDDETMTPALRPDLPGAYEVALRVKNSDAKSKEVYTTITAGPCGAQAPVVSEVQQHPAEPGVGSLIQLYAVAADPDSSIECVGEVEVDAESDGSATTVMVGEAPFSVPVDAYALNYRWRLIARPALSATTLNLDDSLSPTFNPDVSGSYHFEVLVTDDLGMTSEVFVHQVEVSACGEAAPELSVTAPMSGTSGAPVQLASEVTDADNDCGLTQSFSYEWALSSVPAGSAATLNDSSLAAPSFVPDLPGEYVISGVAMDQDGRRSARAEVMVSVDTCGTRPPVISEVTARGLTIERAEDEEPEPEMAGEMMAGEMMAGEMMAGEMMAGEMMAGEMMAGEMNDNEPEVGFDQELIHVGEVVSFSAVVSDPDLDEGCDLDARLDYHWSVVRLPAESSATLNRADARTPSLIADAPGEYTVRLVITDAQGNLSAPAEVDFTVETCGSQAPEGSVTVEPAAPHAGDLISLRADYTDADEACFSGSLSYHWRFESLPAGSEATLNDATAITPSFTADLPGDYLLALVVTDETGRESDLEMTTVSVSLCGANAPVIDSIASAPAVVNAGQPVQLSAVVNDADQDEACGREEQISYHWMLSASPAGSAASLALANTPTPSLLTDLAGDYQVTLMTRDARGFESAPVSYTFTVGACGLSAPEVSLSTSEAAPSVGATIALSADATDADNEAPCAEGQVFSYHWSLLESPAGSAAMLTNAQARTPSVTLDVEGDYLFACEVMDSTGMTSARQTISVSTSACGVAAPTINAVTVEAAPQIGVAASLSVDATDSDNDPACGLAQALSYHWRLTSAPVGSAAMILNSGLSAASVIPDVVGDYVVQVEVTDETGLMSSSSATLTVGECGVRAPTVSDISLAVAEPRVGNPVSASVTVSDLDNDEAGCELDQDVSVHWYISAAPTGSEATLDDPMRAVTSFTPDVPGDYTLRVRATDSAGMMSEWLSATISVNDCGLSSPVIDAVDVVGAQPYLVGAPIRFNPSVSDADRDGCLPEQAISYHWRLISAPADSTAMLANATLSAVDLTPDQPGTYQVGLMVSDDLGLTSPEQVIDIVVDDCGGFAPSVTSLTSDGDDLAWELGVPVRLSSDAQDRDVTDCGLSDPLMYHWALVRIPTGSLARLNDAQLSEPSITPDVDGDYVISLTVSDASGRAATTEQTFSATLCGGEAPVASVRVTSPAVSDVSPFAASVDDIVQLDGGASADPDVACGRGGVLSYHWTLLRVPPASQAELSLADGVTPWFTADAPGLYRVQLIVSDGDMMSEPVVFEVNAD